MIMNRRQYINANAQARALRRAIAASDNVAASNGVSKESHQLTVDARRAHLENLERQLREYDALEKGSLISLEGTLDQIGELFVRARIARRWSQRELAEKLELKEQQIQVYESRLYQRTSTTRLLDVSRALGLTVRLEATPIEQAELGPPRSSSSRGLSARR